MKRKTPGFPGVLRSAPRRTRTYNPLIKRGGYSGHKDNDDKGLRPFSRDAVFSFAINPELGRVVAAWPSLPEHIRAAILMLVLNMPISR